mmetsp:Transcript_22558/g.49916  ORF Transcript_22558/g.49916 Transcript_22558/m.49916 type:complete len:131 (+) Transcript_22558:89-481(+)
MQAVTEFLKNPFQNFTICKGCTQPARQAKSAQIFIDDEEITRMLNAVDAQKPSEAARFQTEVQESLSVVDDCLLFILPKYEEALRAKQTEDSTSAANTTSAILTKLEHSRAHADALVLGYGDTSQSTRPP